VTQNGADAHGQFVESTLASLRVQQAAQTIRGVLEKVGGFGSGGMNEARVEDMAAVECVVPLDQVLAALSEHSRLTVKFGATPRGA